MKDFRTCSKNAQINRIWGGYPKRRKRLFRHTSTNGWGTLPYPKSTTELFDHLIPF